MSKNWNTIDVNNIQEFVDEQKNILDEIEVENPDNKEENKELSEEEILQDAFGDDSEEDNDDEKELEEELNEEEEDDDEEESQEESSDEDDEKEERRKSRASQRIRELNAKFREEETKNKNLEKEILELKNSQLQAQKMQAETQSTLIKNNIQVLEAQKVNALTEGDYAEGTKIDAQLRELELQKAALEEWVKSQPEKIESLEDTQETSDEIDFSNTPEATQDWLEDNSWFLNPKNNKELLKRKY